jgi:3-methyladenine DNA glycosylase AlkD
MAGRRDGVPTKRVSSTVAFFRRRFRDEGDPLSAKAQRAYMKSTLQFHGVDAKQLREAAREFCAERTLDHDDLVIAAEELYATSYFDLHSAAIAILERHRAMLTPHDADWLISLVRRSACWAHVDWIATKLVPLALDKKPDKRLRAWARDDDFWVRRTALLAQLDVLRAGAGDFELFCTLAEPMLAEKEFFIRKAIGWVLREVSKKRPALVRAFVNSHGDQMSGLTRREATKYLPLVALLRRQ